MTIDCDKAMECADSLLKQRKWLISATEQLKNTRIKLSDDNSMADIVSELRKAEKRLDENMYRLAKIILALQRIADNYQSCEVNIEYKYETFCYPEKHIFPTINEFSYLMNLMRDIEFA